jgi:cytochrome c-type biogenesis protein
MSRSVDPLAALVGGLLSFLSPCVLALVPGYVAYLGGASLETARSRRALLGNAGIFVLGFSATFILLFGVFRALLLRLPAEEKSLLTAAGGVLIILLGLQFLGVFRLPFFLREARFQVAHRLGAGSPLSSFAVGVTFALGWTPCVGPILTFILLRAASQDLVGGTGLMLLYCAGLAVPFMGVALLLDRSRPLLAALNRRARMVEGVSGGLLVLVGLLLLSGRFTEINQLLAPIGKYLPQG